MKTKVRLTPANIQALKPKAVAYNTMDTDVRAFGVRTQTSGEKSFVLYRRYPGNPMPVCRTIARVGEMTLSDARELARDWISLCKKGIDPRNAAEQEKAANIEAARKAKVNTVESVLTSYLLAKADLCNARKMKTDMTRELTPWLDRSILSISERDVKDLINAIKARGKKGNARTTYSLIRGFFSWTLESGDFGLDVSPCAKINTKNLVGSGEERKRVLDDDELRAFWKASEKLPYPSGPYLRLLALTALRRTEASKISRDEIHADTKRLIVPGERMKKKLPHLVPLTPRIAELLENLPRHNAGSFVFSTTAGVKPIAAFSKIKADLDAAMEAELAKEGKTLKDGKPREAWVLHDLRRTARTRWSDGKLMGKKIDHEIRERLLAHVPAKLVRTYDMHEFEDEKKDALLCWDRALENIVNPKPSSNVIQMRG